MSSIDKLVKNTEEDKKYILYIEIFIQGNLIYLFIIYKTKLFLSDPECLHYELSLYLL